MSKRKVTESQKKTIAGRQNYKCRGNIWSYKCPLYFKSRDGTFDEAGYEIDHINELSVSNNNELGNLQALCPMCHRVKTNRFNQQKKKKKKPQESIFNVEITLHNHQKVMVHSTKIKQLEGRNIYIDTVKNIFEEIGFNKYRKIGMFKNNKFKHVFDIIEGPPERSSNLHGFMLNEEGKIREWESQHGFKYGEYILEKKPTIREHNVSKAYMDRLFEGIPRKQNLYTLF